VQPKKQKTQGLPGFFDSLLARVSRQNPTCRAYADRPSFELFIITAATL
jgi:hypothetical protein